MIELATSANPEIRRLLERHPRVREVAVGEAAGVVFHQGPWRREVRIGDPSSEQYGLVELMDNNPIVCADVVSVPSPVSTLALVAAGPVAWASLVVDTPSVIASVAVDEAELEAFLATAGWPAGANVHVEPVDLEGVIAVTAMVEVRTPEELDDIDDIYEERFGRSFFVRRDEESAWDPALVRGKPHAAYRMTIAPDAPNSLLTIRALSDLNGKAGAAQVVHAMNVMAGFEESLGITA
jgi:N-acetyl-gamma-glutamylphosphate reductase